MTLLAVAHRAGNDLDALRTAVELGVDVVEADVHVRAGRLEVRHSKHLRPLPLLWDRGPAGVELTRTSVPQLVLERLLDAVDGTTSLLLDLKGPGRVGARAAERVRAAAAPVLVCSRWWPGVDACWELPGVRPVLTARTPFELRRLQRRLVAGRRPYGVSLHRSLLTKPVVAGLRDQVEVVMSWGVNDREWLADVVDLGVNGIISDEADVLRQVLARR